MGRLCVSATACSTSLSGRPSTTVPAGPRLDDVNVTFVPRTRARYFEYAPLFHLLSKRVPDMFGLPLLGSQIGRVIERQREWTVPAAVIRVSYEIGPGNPGATTTAVAFVWWGDSDPAQHEK
ncbi:hypothetical protein [Saccharothrix obliqua]|uniref:hypothetical protein n=1 Tax=Saccharothrix obliqua TaxID=2861747 RepID=UPI001C5E3B32|nr:hypothetical protein [Saccharothrix obliqua]MBW4717397.1 hypothetical protein [Saccharothrix obliqua]